MTAGFLLTLSIFPGNGKCIFQKDSHFPDCAAAGKRKIVAEHIPGLSVHGLPLKGSDALSPDPGTVGNDLLLQVRGK